MFLHSKTKWLWFLALIALLGLALILWRESSGLGQVSARFVGRTVDSAGQVHIIYEITNETRSTIGVSVSTLEAYHERTGWWDLRGMWPAVWRIEKSAGIAQNTYQPTLFARSAALLEIVQPPFWREGSAVRGRVWHLRIESGAVTQLRSIALRLGLPTHRLMWPRPGFIELPETALAVAAQPAAPPHLAAPALQPTSAPIALQPSEEVLPAGSIKFISAPLRSVLDIYAAIADVRLEIDSRVRTLNAEITLQPTQSLTRSDVVRLFERTLEQQAGLSIRRLQSNRVAVTLDEGPRAKSPR